MARFNLDLKKIFIVLTLSFSFGIARAEGIVRWQADVQLFIDGRKSMSDSITCTEKELNALILNSGGKKVPYFVEFQMWSDPTVSKVRVTTNIGKFDKTKRQTISQPSLLLANDEAGFVTAIDVARNKKIKIRFLVHRL